MRFAKVQTPTGPTYVSVEDKDGALFAAKSISGPLYDPIPATFTFQPAPLDTLYVMAPVHPSKIVCVGRNYRDHAAELGNDVPKEPLIFLKPPSSLLEPGGTVLLPRLSQRVDFEGELCLVIGKKCRNLGAEEDAAPYILGYTLLNDVTARDLQKADAQWTRGKGFDTFCPVGPIVSDEVDPLKTPLSITTHLNGELRQTGSTADFLFDTPTLLRFISAFMTLLPGDLIATGTPAGVGAMQPGDVVSVAIEGLGHLRNPVAAEPETAAARPETASKEKSENKKEQANMPNLLEQLKTMTIVVADSGDINSIKKFQPQDSTTNPSLIGAAAQLPEYQSIVDDCLQTARKEAGDSASDKDVAAAAFKTLAVAFGRKILDIVPGRVSTEVDARLSFDTGKTIDQAHDIIAQYDKAGISRDRVLIKIASTWPGIKAAEKLEQEGIHCNLTLLFGLHQAIACAEAKVTLISPFVGRILDWYKNDTGKDYKGADDPGVKSVTTIYNYYKKFDYKTVVMGASFRNIGEITELAGCDLLTIAPKLLAELEASSEPLTRKLDPANAKDLQIEKIHMDEATFEKMHAEDPMAHDKLKEGIEGFSKALEDLEKLLEKRVGELKK